MDAVESSRHGKRKVKDCPFKVIRELTNPKKQKYSLQILKPEVKNSTLGMSYPFVHLKKERADNHHAMYIMHNLNHPNILSMKALAPTQIENSDPSLVVAFVEPYDGLLWSKVEKTSDCADRLRHIPNPEFRGFLRGIVIGLDYLWMRELYHGNLSWYSTLYYQETAKLAGFEELKVPKDEARWNDVLCFIKMLEEIANRASSANQNLSQEKSYFYGELNSLISLLKTLKQKPFSRWKEIILENTFFWNIPEKVKFFAIDVSLLLTNEQFMQRVRLSPPCGEDWGKNCTAPFKVLVDKMNEYRESQKRKCRGTTSSKPYDGKSGEDYVRCVCGAFTHWKQLKLDVDQIVRKNHPTICSDFKHLVENSVDLVPTQLGPSSNLKQHGTNKVNASSKPSKFTLAGSKKGREQGKQQWVVKAANKVPIQSHLEHDMTEATDAGKTSNLPYAGADEGKEQNKQSMAKASSVQIGSLTFLVEHDTIETTASGKASSLTTGFVVQKEGEKKQCTAKISESKSSKNTDGSSACGG